MDCRTPLFAAVLCSLALSGCAAGTASNASDGSALDLQGQHDTAPDHYIWPDLGPPPDAFVPLEVSSPDGISPPADLSPPADSQVCVDPHEPNESCSGGTWLGAAAEGSGWVEKSGTLNPSNDVDWFTATGEEAGSFCLPGTSQCLSFSVRVDVPAGRRLRVCVYEGSCATPAECSANDTVPGPFQLTVTYVVNGTCALNDDTDAKIIVEQLDNAGGCDPYVVAFSYDDC